MITDRPAPSPAPLPASAVWLVAEREITAKLRSRAFVIATGILLLIALAAVLIGGLASRSASPDAIAVTSETAAVAEALPDVEPTLVADRSAAETLVKDDEVSAAIVPGDESGFGFVVLTKEDAPTSLMMQLSQVPKVEVLEPADTDPLLRYLVAIGFGVVFLMAASTFGGTIAQSVVEEKQTRVVELLISAIPTRELLAGKVLGNTVLAMGQIVALAAIAIVGLIVTGQNELLAGIGAPVLWFAVFFLFGFVLLASLYAAAAAMVSRQEDIGSTTMPLMMLVMAPYFLVIFFNDNPLVLTIMSYVPFSAPVAMPVRMFVGEAQWWEGALSLAILLATCAGAIVVAAKIYENSLLRMGARVKLGEALRG
ncbi:ABC transporter permease [Microbacterium sp. USHLN186]|uniref:ABC transporter permease n=1 Tax=Microbacterium sp. USHLN186 TaxID=3081286 RepID=UPI003019D3ED